MDRTPCFHTAETRRHLGRIEAADSALEELHAELTNDMERALAGLQSHVPGYRSSSARTIETLQGAADEVHAALDFSEVMEALMLGLKDGEGQHWTELRRLVVKRYVNENADVLADVRGVA